MVCSYLGHACIFVCADNCSIDCNFYIHFLSTGMGSGVLTFNDVSFFCSATSVCMAIAMFFVHIAKGC